VLGRQQRMKDTEIPALVELSWGGRGENGEKTIK